MINDRYSNKLEVLDFEDMPKEDCIIKVIGVGGGGGNAVNHMFRETIRDVTFVNCNTDRQALNNSPVPTHLQLGEGLGAGNKPEVARKAAEESDDNIRRMLNDGTKMSFITAGMGGGTGTGAAPVIARVSKELGILTVGIVESGTTARRSKKSLDYICHLSNGKKKDDVLAAESVSNNRIVF